VSPLSIEQIGGQWQNYVESCCLCVETGKRKEFVLLYLITYDLRAPGRAYPAVIEKIESFGNSIKILESAWLVRSLLTTTTIRDSLQAAGDTNDGFFVAQLGGTHAWSRILPPSDTVKKFIANS
jgi:hypothetical protein